MSKSHARTTGEIDHALDVYSQKEIDGFKATGLWSDRLVIDALVENAEKRPDDIAVVDRQRRATWAHLHARVETLATALAALGLFKNDFIAIQLPNWIEYVETFLASQRAGLKPLTMMSIYREHDVKYMIEKCRARALVVPDTYRGFDHSGMAESIRYAVPSLTSLIVVGAPRKNQVGYEGLIAGVKEINSAELDTRRPDPDHVSRIGFTSGTTALPKAVVHTHNTDSVPPVLVKRALDLNSSTPIWMPSPIAHVTGLLFGVYESVICGAKLVLQDKWDATLALKLISEEGVVFTVGATPFIAELVEHDELQRYDLSTLKFFASGGAPVPADLVFKAKDRLGCSLLRVFGHSEAPLHTLNLPDDPWVKRTATDGKPLPHCAVKIVDPSRRENVLAAGQVGEYATRGPHVFLGYYGEPERTQESRDSEGWFYSGDLCELDRDGYVIYVDRIKDIVNRGGVKISALEIENSVRGHPAVRDVAVVALPDWRLVEKAAAFVVLYPNKTLSLNQISDFLHEQGITKQKWPESLYVVDRLPTTATGKVQKNILRESVMLDGNGGDRQEAKPESHGSSSNRPAT